MCNTLEDENHSLFICKAHDFIRISYVDFLRINDTVAKVLNPQSHPDVKLVADYLRKIEKNMEELQMLQ